ncbi:MAG: CSLREA domain-containing protein [Solirubrobacterales bacterium]
MQVDAVGGRRRGRATVAALIVLACAFASAPPANAAELMVDSTADAVDVAPGDESCLTAGGECTLRAAIEEANGLGEFTRIDFEEETFEGQAAATIALGSGLPAVGVPAFVNGRTCETEAGISGPCVGIEGPSGEPALTAANTEEVEISGLAITGAQTAVSLEASPRSKVQGSWLGVALDGTVAGNETGILVGPGSNRSLIGGEGPGLGNVLAGNVDDGLDVHGGNGVRVFGNYFGVEPDGVTPAANGGDNVEVASTEGLEMAGTAIGTRPTFGSSATTPECDGGCNLISGAVSDGVDLEGDGGDEVPAVATTIAGNHIGLDATGRASIPNALAGIRVGSAAQTVIGGPKAGEANRVNGGEVGVLAGPAAPDLVVRGNLVGLDLDGTATLAPPAEAVAVDSGELATPALEATIADNRIWMEGGVAIAQQGFGARIADNEIVGAEAGIRIFGFTGEHGNLIEGNYLEGLEGDGILVENDLNEILGNEIFEAIGAGIRILGPLPFGVTGNVVGGDVAVDENFIAGSGGAIEIVNAEATANEVARNAGIANGGLFIDLVAAGPEPNGPNNGIEPPALSGAGQTGAGGSGAEAGAAVRVFRKERAEAGELESFLGEAIAGEAGDWEVAYAAAIPAGTIVAATQTSAGGTSELALAVTADEGIVVEDGGCAFVAGVECQAGGQAGGGSAGVPTAGSPRRPAADARPQTKIVKIQRKRSRPGAVRLEFKSSVRGSRFLCKLDRKPFDLCSSPKKYSGLAPGRHTFRVRAVGPTGRVDSSPATKRFVVPGRA